MTNVPLINSEQVQVLHYDPTQKYDSHHDFFDPQYYKSQPNTLKMIDNGEEDDKLIGIPAEDLNFPRKFTDDNNNIYPNYLEEIKFFLRNYKKLENKHVEVTDYLSKDKAEKLVTRYQLK